MVRPLPVAARDAWLMAAAALAGRHVEQAQEWARQAMEAAGWQRYRLVYGQMDTTIYRCDLLPCEWAYRQRVGYRQSLLVHPVAAPFFVLAPDFAAMAAAMNGLDDGLVPVEEILTAGVLSELAPGIPDSPAGLG